MTCNTKDCPTILARFLFLYIEKRQALKRRLYIQKVNFPSKKMTGCTWTGEPLTRSTRPGSPVSLTESGITFFYELGISLTSPFTVSVIDNDIFLSMVSVVPSAVQFS